MTSCGLPAPTEEEEQTVSVAGRGAVFILENASLETAKVGKTYQLLNVDDHGTFLRRHGKDPSQYRPDICHQALLSILDSPLNKAGYVKALYVHTAKGVLISVNPRVRLPRTFRRFCGLMVQLLQRLSIRASAGHDKLLKVVKGPVTKYLPAGSTRIAFSHSSPSVIPLKQLVLKLPADGGPVVFSVGAMAHGKIDCSYADQWVSISAFPLSAACCLSKITNALEWKWDIL